MLHTLNRDVKSLGNLTHINHLIGRDVLNEGLAADLSNNLIEASAEIQVILHLRGDLNDLPLEVHVATVEEVLNHIFDLRITNHLHEVLEARG